MYENWIFIFSAALLAAIVGSAIVGINAMRSKSKLEIAQLVELYADLLVRFAEQTGNIKGMSGAEKKMMVMSLLKEALPDVPNFILDAAVEAAVLLLNKTSKELSEELDKVVGG